MSAQAGTPPAPGRILPAAVVCLRAPGLAVRSWDPVARRLEEAVSGAIGLTRGALLVPARHGDPGVLDRAVAAAFGIRELTKPDGPFPELADLGIVLMTVPVTFGARAPRASPDPLLRELLDEDGPALPAGIYLTSRAVAELEHGWPLVGGPPIATRSGPTAPLSRVTAPRSAPRAPWRNPKLLGRDVPLVPRAGLAEAAGALGRQHLRVTGPLGSGKSRWVRSELDRSGTRACWVALGAAPEPAPAALARQLAALAGADTAARVDAALGVGPDRGAAAARALLPRLLAGTGPLTVVVDDLHLATAEEVGWIEDLAATTGTPVLHLLARPGLDWPRGTESWPAIEVGPMAEGELAAHLAALAAGLDLPASVRDRFLAAAGGLPFLLEEGVVGLIHRRLVRRHYGSFFFNGPEATEWEASDRLKLHLATELDRLDLAFPLLTVAAAEGALPPAALEAVAARFAAEVPPHWIARAAGAGLAMPTPSAWGRAVAASSPGIATALAATLTDESRRQLRGAAGRAVAEIAEDAAGWWAAYPLVRGTELGREALLRAASRPPEGAREALRGALAFELEQAEVGRDPDLERRLLWALLPLAHREARLHEHRRHLERALAITRDEPRRALAAETLFAELETAEGRLEEAEVHLRRALALAVETEPRRRHLLGVELARLLLRRNRRAEAKRLLETLVAELDRPGTAALAATCRFLLANLALREGQPEAAAGLHRESLAERERQGLAAAIGASLCGLGQALLAAGDYPEALASFERALPVLREHGRPGEIAYALTGKGTALLRLGKVAAASRPLREAIEARAGHESSYANALARLAMAECHLAIDRLDAAQEDAREAHFALSVVAETAARGDAAQILGRILLRQRRPDEARRHLEEALEIHRRHQDRRGVLRDRAALLEDALAREEREEIEVLVRLLDDEMARPPYPERGEIVDATLFRALEWLAARRAVLPAPPVRVLRRAYRFLLDKAAFLAPDQRTPFLIQIPEHQAIVDAAARHRLSLPALM